MGGCSAMDCSNRSENGHRLYVFPADETRRKIWVTNTRRINWTPGRSAALCEVHFEEKAFELNRADGRRKLKPNAIPTIFEVPSPPKKRNLSPRKSLHKKVKSKENLQYDSSDTDTEQRKRKKFPSEQITDDEISLISDSEDCPYPMNEDIDLESITLPLNTTVAHRAEVLEEKLFTAYIISPTMNECVLDWDIHTVKTWLGKKYPENIARVFECQEIDGEALILMNENDLKTVLNNEPFGTLKKIIRDIEQVKLDHKQAIIERGFEPTSLIHVKKDHSMVGSSQNTEIISSQISSFNQKVDKLSTEVEDLKKENSKLKAEIDDLRKENMKFQKNVERMEIENLNKTMNKYSPLILTPKQKFQFLMNNKF